jgi:hypothetical protein
MIRYLRMWLQKRITVIGNGTLRNLLKAQGLVTGYAGKPAQDG